MSRKQRGTVTLRVAGRPLTFTSRSAGRAEFDLAGGERDDFNRLHPRGFGGKFGRKLAQIAGLDLHDQNTEISFPGREDIDYQFDWDEPDEERPGRGFSYLNITAPMDVEDADVGGTFTDAVTAKLHMTESDYAALARSMSGALLNEHMRQNPLPDDDPRALYIASLLDLQDHEVMQFDAKDNPWGDDQLLEFSRETDGSYHFTANDEWGDEVDFALTPQQFAALHAQLMRRVGTGVQPSGPKPAGA